MKRYYLLAILVLTVIILLGLSLAGFKPCHASGLRDFADEGEMLSFLESDTTDSRLEFNDGVIPFNAMVNNPCWYYASQLVRHANDRGFQLYLFITTDDNFHRFWYGRSLNGYGHCACLARIGQDIYYIEPQMDMYLLYARIP